ncbi:MAG: hypothetical protein ACRDJY_02900 [Thermoleophilaceae bacterium]
MVEALPDPRSIALALAITIALLGVAGAIVGTDSFQDEGPLADRLFNLVNEKTIPAFFSGAILVAGGLCSLLAARCRLYGRHRLWIGFGALLILMSADEVVQFHERIESWTGVDWEQPYLVVVLGAAVIWVKIVRLMDHVPRVMMICGAVCWAISYALEDAEYDSSDNRVGAFTPLAISEELLEMAGSSLFLLALVVALKANARRPSYA